jgi:TatD DNase family protein
MLIDSHAHLCDARFDPDRDEVIRRAFDAGVGQIIEIAYHEPLWEKSRALSERYPGQIFWAAGLHPCHVDEYDEDFPRRLAEALKHPGAVAVGEIGLDYYHNPDTRAKQQDVLPKLFQVARQAQKPVIIHCRNGKAPGLDSYADTLSLLQSFQKDGGAPLRGTAHCFQGSAENARAFMDLGFFLGVDGPLTYPNAAALRALVEPLPLERLLLETDCPYLPPQPHRGQRNEPAYVAAVAQALAEQKKASPQVVAEKTTANARSLFALPS